MSVIIPTHDRPELLREAVASVLAQTEADLECIVVDDAGTADLALPDDPRVVVIRRRENGGAAIARNDGMERARGQFVTFLDDDDLFTADRVAIALPLLEDASVALCWSRRPDEPGSPQRVLAGSVYDRILDATTPHLSTVLLRREMAPRFNPRYRACEDLDWWLRLTQACRVATVAEFGSLIRVHPGIRHLSGDLARIQFSRVLLDEHADYFATHPPAAAFRWFRIGLLAARLGDHRLARRAYARSLRLRFRAKLIVHFARSLRPSRGVVDLDGAMGASPGHE